MHVAPRPGRPAFGGQGPLHLLEIGAGRATSADTWPEVRQARQAGREVRLTLHDAVPFPGIAVVHDLERRPWPFADASFDGLLAEQVLEHLDNLGAVMEEVCRIVRPGGLALVGVPYALGKAHFQDWTHRTAFTEHTFDYFAPAGAAPPYSEFNYTSRARVLVERLEVIHGHRPRLGIGLHAFEKYLGRAVQSAVEPLFRDGPLGLRFALRVVGLESTGLAEGAAGTSTRRQTAGSAR